MHQRVGHVSSGTVACKLICEKTLGAVQKLFIQNAKDEFVSARRRREACRGTLTDDNAAMADSDKHNV